MRQDTFRLLVAYEQEGQKEAEEKETPQQVHFHQPSAVNFKFEIIGCWVALTLSLLHVRDLAENGHDVVQPAFKPYLPIVYDQDEDGLNNKNTRQIQGE